MVLRDIELVRLTGGSVHFLHLSTGRSVELVSNARDEGLAVSFEVAPHHFTLDESACTDYDPVFKVHPPLRARSDVDALVDALSPWVVDAVATDHAPHAPELKDLAFDEAPAGMLGLEEAASLTLEALGASPDPLEFFRLLSRGPARIAQLRRDDYRVRHSAHGANMLARPRTPNVTVFDPGVQWVVDRTTLASRSIEHPVRGTRRMTRARSRDDRQGHSSSMRVASRDTTALDPRVERAAPLSRATPPVTPRRGFTSGESSFKPPRCRVTRRAHHRPQLRRSDHQFHLPAHRQLRRDPARPTSRCTRGATCVVMRDDSPTSLPTGVRWPLEGFLRQHRVAAIVGVDTRRPDPAPALPRRLPGAFGHGDPNLVAAAAQRALGTDDTDLVRRVTTPRSTRSVRCASRRGVGLRHQDDDGAPPRPTLSRQRRAGCHQRREIRSLHPDGVFLSNGPGDPAALANRWPYWSNCSDDRPIFGICLGHNCSLRPSADEPSNFPSVTTAATTRSVTSRPAGSRSRLQNHNYAVEADSLERGVVTRQI